MNKLYAIIDLGALVAVPPLWAATKCPTASLTSITDCSEGVMNTRFSVPKGMEEDYFFEWRKDGKLLNEFDYEGSTLSKADKDSLAALDAYNSPSIEVSKFGIYTVAVYYVGTDTTAECDVARDTASYTPCLPEIYLEDESPCTLSGRYTAEFDVPSSKLGEFYFEWRKDGVLLNEFDFMASELTAKEAKKDLSVDTYNSRSIWHKGIGTYIVTAYRIIDGRPDSAYSVSDTASLKPCKPKVDMEEETNTCRSNIVSSYFSPLDGWEDYYYYEWRHNGDLLNEFDYINTKLDRAEADKKRLADKYNRPWLYVSETGEYTVTIYLVGSDGVQEKYSASGTTIVSVCCPTAKLPKEASTCDTRYLNCFSPGSGWEKQYSFEWEHDGKPISGGSKSLRFTDTGNYKVSVKYIGSDTASVCKTSVAETNVKLCCPNPKLSNFTVEDMPSEMDCNFYGETDLYKYTWTVNGVKKSANASTYPVSEPGIYTVEVRYLGKMKGECPSISASATAAITVPRPEKKKVEQVNYVGTTTQVPVIHGGGTHAVAVASSGEIYAWGSNRAEKLTSDPILGVGSLQEFVPTPTKVKSNGVLFTMASAGSGDYNVALSQDGVAYAWGSAEYLAKGKNYYAIEYPTPVACGAAQGYDLDGSEGGKYLGNVKMVTATTYGGLALLGDGRVVSWGNDWDKDTLHLPEFVMIDDTACLTDVVYIDAGDNGCAFITSNNEMYYIGKYFSDTKTLYAKKAPFASKLEQKVADCAMGDVAMFAVTTDGKAWGCGNGGWNNASGVGGSRSTTELEQIQSGEYGEVSGEKYLTNVRNIVAGRGHGMALLNDGYVVYWGCNDGNGGVAPFDEKNVAKDYLAGHGMVSVLAHYCDAKGGEGKLVDDAVYIARGDNFDFMINSKNEVYVSGLNDEGQTGLGISAEEIHCFMRLDFPFDGLMPQPATVPCAELEDTNICDGDTAAINSGFRMPIGLEDDYFFQWQKDGETLNTSKQTSKVSARRADKYNSPYIKVTDEGLYKLDVIYIGEQELKTKKASASAYVSYTSAPVDTFVEIAGESDITFSAIVNEELHTSSDKCLFLAYPYSRGGSPISAAKTLGAGDDLQFTIPEEAVKDVAISDQDTIYTIWVEDVSSLNTSILKSAEKIEGKTEYLTQYALLKTESDVVLNSFNISLKDIVSGYFTNDIITIVPELYEVTFYEYYDSGFKTKKIITSGSKQEFVIDADEVECKVSCKFTLHPGKIYALTLNASSNHSYFSVFEHGQSATSTSTNMYPMEFDTPLQDVNGYGVSLAGIIDYGGVRLVDYSIFSDFDFNKYVEYECGRFKMQAKRSESIQPTSVESIEGDKEPIKGAYSANGVCLGDDADISSLPAGVYVIDGKKVVIGK